jgi:hypothetical protein
MAKNNYSADIDHPSHYNSHPSGIECIDVVEYFTFNIGNAIKYCWRAGLKIGALSYQDILSANIKDLRKAEWYIRREIERLEKRTESP